LQLSLPLPSLSEGSHPCVAIQQKRPRFSKAYMYDSPPAYPHHHLRPLSVPIAFSRRFPDRTLGGGAASSKRLSRSITDPPKQDPICSILDEFEVPLNTVFFRLGSSFQGFKFPEWEVLLSCQLSDEIIPERVSLSFKACDVIRPRISTFLALSISPRRSKNRLKNATADR